MLLAPERTLAGFWNQLYNAKDCNNIITAYVAAVVPSETLRTRTWKLEFVEFEDVPTYVYGTVPYSETGLSDEELMNFFIKKEIKVKIKGIDKKNGIVVCTRREVVEESRTRIIHMIEEGQEIETMVSYVTDMRVGLDIGGGVIIDLNRRKAATSRSVPLGALYTEGTIVKAVVQGVDKNTKGIEISLVDPWQGLHYPRGTVISCPVVHLGEKDILFVSAHPGVVGITSCQEGRDKPELGERLLLQVEEFDPTEKLLRFGEYAPEKIRGRRKNRAYWRRYREEKKEQTVQEAQERNIKNA